MFNEIHPAVSLIVPYKMLPFSEIILKRAPFFSPLPPPPPSPYPFQTFVGLREPLGDIYILFEHTFVSCIIAASSWPHDSLS